MNSTIEPHWPPLKPWEAGYFLPIEKSRLRLGVWSRHPACWRRKQPAAEARRLVGASCSLPEVTLGARCLWERLHFIPQEVCVCASACILYACVCACVVFLDVTSVSPGAPGHTLPNTPRQRASVPYPPRLWCRTTCCKGCPQALAAGQREWLWSIDQFLKTTLLSYNLHAIKLPHLNCTIPNFCMFTELYNHHYNLSLEHSVS